MTAGGHATADRKIWRKTLLVHVWEQVLIAWECSIERMLPAQRGQCGCERERRWAVQVECGRKLRPRRRRHADAATPTPSSHSDPQQWLFQSSLLRIWADRARISNGRLTDVHLSLTPSHGDSVTLRGKNVSFSIFLYSEIRMLATRTLPGCVSLLEWAIKIRISVLR